MTHLRTIKLLFIQTPTTPALDSSLINNSSNWLWRAHFNSLCPTGIKWLWGSKFIETQTNHSCCQSRLLAEPCERKRVKKNVLNCWDSTVFRQLNLEKQDGSCNYLPHPPPPRTKGFVESIHMDINTDMLMSPSVNSSALITPSHSATGGRVQNRTSKN